ncbi:ThuA domain-containing protein [Saccharothrix sp. NRRL B-16314]|uniref:ThuA domain-containing protein n=1 Tax=Saccharothrix sp. NRRL B-16314 TaxID=1463825 RepID=UPI0005269CBA|nr:ThuA domain-containing protein [Saccharothrix sp. NRRL B-16314]
MKALVVRGGWEGHSPVEATDAFLPFLRAEGFSVDVSESLEVYDADLGAYDLILQCWSDGELTDDQFACLDAAVRSGTGLAGWHGGLVDSFRHSREYMRLVGGQFVAHPGDFVDHRVEITSTHPIVEGLDGFALRTEQYWVLTDDLNDVHATTTFAAGSPWHAQLTVPAVWTRRWGAGRVFACTIGHFPADLALPPVRTLVERGLLWAARPAR